MVRGRCCCARLVLRELLAALAVLVVGGTALLRQKRHELRGAVLLLEHLAKGDHR
jgi:hypothetical protein